MNDLRTLKELFGHMEWADAIVFKAVLSNAQATADAKLRELLFHLHMVQRLFLTVWQKGSFIAPPAEAPDLISVGESAREYYAALDGFLSGLEEAALGDPIVVPWAGRLSQRLGREPDAPTLAETCLQVAMHSTYHRGQINARLRAIGGEPPLTDFIAWVWFGKPAAEWPDMKV